VSNLFLEAAQNPSILVPVRPEKKEAGDRFEKESLVASGHGKCDRGHYGRFRDNINERSPRSIQVDGRRKLEVLSRRWVKVKQTLIVQLQEENLSRSKAGERGRGGG